MVYSGQRFIRVERLPRKAEVTVIASCRSFRLIIGGGGDVGFLGQGGGFLVGTILGVVVGAIALGLDGALLGMALLALAGVIGGVIFGCKLETTSTLRSTSQKRRRDPLPLFGVFPIIGPEPTPYYSLHHLSMH